MTTMPRRGLLALVLFGVLLAAPTLLLADPGAAVAGAASKTPHPLLQQGSHGPRTAGLQWLLGGHKPSVYRGLSTFQWKPNGLFGSRTAAAVVAMKERLGWPSDRLQPVAGGDLFEILTGKRARPPGYILRAGERLAEEKQIEARRASTECARRLISFEVSQIGVHEIPDGSNRGPRISYAADGIGPYQGATGAFGLAWCASFQAYSYRVTHIGFPNAWNGYLADSEATTAGVFAIRASAQARGWVRAVPEPGYLVAFLDGAGHIGAVDHVFTTGILAIEGNTGNAVRRRWHAFGSRPMVYIAIPGCDGG